MVAERDDGKRFTAINVPDWRDFAHAQRAAWSLTQGHIIIWPCVKAYTVLPDDNSILITANMQSETGFPSSHQLKSYVA